MRRCSFEVFLASRVDIARSCGVIRVVFVSVDEGRCGDSADFDIYAAKARPSERRLNHRKNTVKI